MSLHTEVDREHPTRHDVNATILAELCRPRRFMKFATAYPSVR